MINSVARETANYRPWKVVADVFMVAKKNAQMKIVCGFTVCFFFFFGS